MAHIRRLPARGQPKDTKEPKGLWQATVRHPSGRRWSKSDPLKRVVKEWADDEEAKIRRGEWIDPNAGKITLAAWWGKWFEMQRLEVATADKYTSWWRNHIEPQFGPWPLASIQSWDVEAWVTKMSTTHTDKDGQSRGPVGAETMKSSLRLLSQLLKAAVRHKLLTVNTAAVVTAPTPDPHIDRILTREEADRLLAEFTGQDRVFVELLLYCGLRFQEAAGLRRFRVDLLRKRVTIAKVQPRKGGEKKPKTDAGTRPVPLTDGLVVELSQVIPAPDDGLVITSPQGTRLRYDNWYRRVWVPAVKRAGLVDPQPTPHDLRHTYGSWLADAGRPPHEIAALMGHKSLRSVERYIHASEQRFEGARQALESRAAGERQEPTSTRSSVDRQGPSFIPPRSDKSL
jgi:integrase